MALVAGTTEQTWEWHATVASAPALTDARSTWTVADVVSGSAADGGWDDGWDGGCDGGWGGSGRCADATARVVRLSQPVPVRMVRPRRPGVGVRTP